MDFILSLRCYAGRNGCVFQSLITKSELVTFILFFLSMYGLDFRALPFLLIMAEGIKSDKD